MRACVRARRSKNKKHLCYAAIRVVCEQRISEDSFDGGRCLDMAQRRSTLKEEVAEWRKLLRRIAERLDRPMRLDRNWTRGRYGVCYDPLPPRRSGGEEE